MPNKRILFIFILTLLSGSFSIGQNYNPYYGGIVEDAFMYSGSSTSTIVVTKAARLISIKH